MDPIVAGDDGGYVLRLSSDEVIVLCEALGRAEWADDLEVVELEWPAERKVVEDLMLALRPGVSALGTDAYGPAVRDAQNRVMGTS